jgi:asparagine N-glycosylation enzyme membrane subunit Stt3
LTKEKPINSTASLGLIILHACGLAVSLLAVPLLLVGYVRNGGLSGWMISGGATIAGFALCLWLSVLAHRREQRRLLHIALGATVLLALHMALTPGARVGWDVLWILLPHG